MADMSLGKLLVLAILILVAWYGFKYVARVEAMRQSVRAEAARRRMAGEAGRRRAQTVEDLVKCTTCGAFVAAEGTANCGKRGCPWGA